jgi:sarcosine oxidase subunit alpha
VERADGRRQRTYGITPYGTETMHVLRAEKGYVIVGQDTDGSVTPIDLGMDWIVAKDKDFLGRRSLSRADTARPDRKHLVGLLTEDPSAVLPEGGQIVTDPNARIPTPMHGHVTSSYFSANLKRSIALGLVQNGRNRMGEKVSVETPGGNATIATIAKPVFLDPKGRGRMRESILRESPLVRLNRASSGANSAAGAGLIVREKAFLGHLNLRGKAEDPHFAGAVGVVMGDELPIVANTLTELNGVTMYWLGPDEWLIVTPTKAATESSTTCAGRSRRSISR